MTSTDTMTIQVVPLKDAIKIALKKQGRPYRSKKRHLLTESEKNDHIRASKLKYEAKIRQDPIKYEALNRRKRESQRIQREKIRSDPVLYEIQKKRWHEQYLKKRDRESGRGEP
jgi:hypothetical protein